jgi:hypothetical protein
MFRWLFTPGNSAQFWIGQICVIISTIVGVYLAASAGFTQAVKFERLMNSRDRYYLATSLNYELRDNHQKFVKVIEAVRKQGSYDSDMKPIVANFIWNTMQESEATLTIPPAVLVGVSRYYIQAEKLFFEVDRVNRKWLSRTPLKFADDLELLNQRLEKNIFPILDKERKSLQTILSENQIEVLE